LSARSEPLRQVIARHGLSASKALGQNFILDRQLLARVAAIPGPLKGERVYEVGPGPGGLTRALLDRGAHRVIVGTETLPRAAALERLLAEVPDGALILSVDLRDGRALSPDPQLGGLPALDAVARLHRPGLREAIVLDLARVGSGAGPDVALIAEIHAAFPDLELLAGGGVRDVEDLRALDAAGAAGALVATALHSGVIGPRELAGLR
jgi:uncharacterized protein related to proFAR isomerase